MDTAAGLVAGETLVDLFPEGETLTAGGFRHRPGGAPANVAVALARLGPAPDFYTRLADDDFGRFLRDTLDDEGIPKKHVREVPGKTALAVVTPGPDGERSFSFYEPETALAFDPRRIEPDGYDWLAFGGVALTNESGREALCSLAERTTGTVFFDPNARVDLWADERSTLAAYRRALAATDVLVASVEDLVAFGVDPERAAAHPETVAAELRERGPEAVFLTRGADGAVGTTDSGTARVPAFDVDALDTTGAGDAFTAGVVARYEPGAALPETLRYASAVAALTTTAEGAMAALPGPEPVARLLEGGR